jgi:single-stranded DNA-binding protein
MYELLTIKGSLIQNTEVAYTNNGKLFCKTKMFIDNDLLIQHLKSEHLNIIGWERVGEELNEFNKNDTVIITGYLKYNNFTKKEELTCTDIKKQEVLK